MGKLGLRNRSIATRLTWTNMVVTAGALLLACAGFSAYDFVTSRQTMVRRLSTQAQIIGFNSTAALLFNDHDSAKQTLSALRASPNVLFAGVYRADGKPFASYSREGREQPEPLPSTAPDLVQAHWFQKGRIALLYPILVDGRRVGGVYLLSDLREINNRLKRYAAIAAIVLTGSLVAAFFMMAPFRRALAEPIVSLAQTAAIVSREKNYAIRSTAKGSFDEMTILIESFNSMLARIQESSAELEKTQERLNLALKSSGVGTWDWDIRNHAIVWDDYLHPLFGLQPGVFSGKYEDF
ncbi:MAG: CHASE sensor domain-containing protein, partial [Gammaproteobacteria bacterium]